MKINQRNIANLCIVSNIHVYGSDVDLRMHNESVPMLIIYINTCYANFIFH